LENNFEILEWDSVFFGFKVAKINEFNSMEEYKRILSELRLQEVKLAYCFCIPGSNIDNSLSSEGVFLVDEKVTYARIINEDQFDAPEVNIHVYSEGVVSDKMLDIALQTSEHSRFRVDTNFQNEEFKKLYYQWIKNAVENCKDGELFTYEEGATLKGLIYLKEVSDKIGSISLIGVDQGYRGEQIGTKLINQSLSYFKRKKKNEIQVVTQKQNVLACNFYEKNYFKLIDTVNVYHIWI